MSVNNLRSNVVVCAPLLKKITISYEYIYLSECSSPYIQGSPYVRSSTQNRNIYIHAYATQLYWKKIVFNARFNEKSIIKYLSN